MIAAHMIPALRRYVDFGTLPDTLTRQALEQPTDVERVQLAQFGVPPQAFGSVDAVAAWTAHAGREMRGPQ